MENQLCIVVRGGRDGDVFRGGIDLPTRGGLIQLSGEVPAPALRRFAGRTLEVLSALRNGSVGGELVGELVGHADEVGVPLLGQLANGAADALGAMGPLGGLAGMGLRGLASLFGGGPPQPRTRAGNLPPVGSAINRARLLGRTGVVPGMNMNDVRAKLNWGLTQDWAWDLEDVRVMLRNLPAQGTVRSVDELGAALGAPIVNAPPPAPAPSPAAPGMSPQMMQMFQRFMAMMGGGVGWEPEVGVRALPRPARVARPRPRNARPARPRRPGAPVRAIPMPGAVRALVAIARGNADPFVIAPTLAGSALLAAAAPQLAAAMPSPVTESAQRVVAMATRALDARAAIASNDPASQADAQETLDEAYEDAADDPEVAEALEISEGFADQ